MDLASRAQIPMTQKVTKLITNTAENKNLETKAALDNSKALRIIKSANIQKPMLRLWDYLNRSQQEKHEMSYKQKDISVSEKLNALDKNKHDELNVIIYKKYAKKTTKILENHIHRKRKSSMANRRIRL